MAVSLIDRGKAVLFQQWIKSIIGQTPPMYEYEDHIEIDFTPEQIQLIKDYLNRQVRGAFMPSDAPPPKVQIRFGKFLIPWSIENAVPFLAASFGLGYLTKHVIGGK